MILNVKNTLTKITTTAVTTMASAHVIAADGFDKADQTINATVVGLASLAVGTITLATMWVGYKVLADGKSLSDMKNIMIGAALIAGAAGFGALWAA